MNPRDLERRLRRLERSNSLLLAGLVIVTALFLVAAAPSSSAQEVIRAERVEIVDAEGRVRMQLKHDSEETGLFILDEFGDRRLGAAQFAHGGGFALHGPEAKGAAVLYLRGDGSLTFYDEAGEVVNRFPSQP
jgi:hypothetical protein